jgi:bifunctional DNA-binding transcriptional regulator/antitoxin component of YhaV-PrlF toxin-antitoxin module
VKTETRVTSKGQTTIPGQLRKQAGISEGTILTWQIRNNALVARPLKDKSNAMQQHIRARAGTWRGKLSGVELLKRTRP